MIPRKLSLVLTMAIAIALVTAGVLGAFAWLNNRTERQRLLESLQREHEILADQLAVSLALPIWNFDREQLARIAEGALDDAEVVAVVVRPVDVSHSLIGRRRVPDGTVKNVQATDEIPRELTRITRPIEAERENVGEVSVYVTTRLVEASLAARLLASLERIAVLDVILIASVYGIMWWLLLRPLRVLQADAIAISEDRRAPVSSAAHEFRGEMETLRASLLSILETMRARYEEISRSETRFREVVLKSDIGLAVLDGNLTIVKVSPSLCGMLGYSREELLVMDPLTLIHPDDLPAMRANIARLRAGELETYRSERRYQPKTGGHRWVDLSVNTLRDSLGAVTQFFLQLQDITERKAREEEIGRLNRLYQVLSQVNAVLVRANTNKDVFAAVCRILVEVGQFKIAWIGWLDQQTRRLNPVAVEGDRHDYVRGVAISADPDHPHSRGPGGTALREDRTNVCNDFIQDLAALPWRDGAVRAGIHASIALPLHQDGKVVGLLTVYAAEQDFFQASEVEQLEEAASNISFALDVLASRDRQREAEIALRESEEQFRSTMISSAIGMAIIAADNRVIDVNPAVCRLLGYAREELLAKSPQAVTHPDDRAAGWENFQRVLSGELQATVHEKRYLHKAGHVIWAQLTLSAVRDSLGRVTHCVAQVQDVTERKQTFAQLAELTERLRLALEIGRLSVWQHWLRTNNTVWDARTYELFGFAPGSEPPSFERLVERVHPDDQSAFRSSVDTLLRSGGETRHSFRLLTPDGGCKHIVAYSFVQRDERGAPEWMLGVNADITEIVTATTKAERYRAQLVQAQKMETLGQLAGGVVHDFNNLLTGINGFVDLAALTLPRGHEGLALLEQAKRAAGNARDLARRILVFTRQAPSGQRARVRLGDLVRDVAPLLAKLLPSLVALELELAADEPQLLADAGQIQQVLMNLCGNAAHAIGRVRGTVRVAVDTCNPTAGDATRQLRLRVSDTGCGMDRPTLARVFEPFFTTKPAGEGTGLGLSIVQSIVQDHGGTITIDSAVGQGTTFTLHFPIEAATQPPGALIAPAAEQSDRMILVADDEAAVTTLTVALLRRAGYAAVGFSSAREAWRAFAADAGRFKLILTDCVMPEMSGVEFMQRARALSRRVAVVLMTGYVEQIPRPTAENPFQIIAKPFETSDLLRVIRDELAKV